MKSSSQLTQFPLIFHSPNEYLSNPLQQIPQELLLSHNSYFPTFSMLSLNQPSYLSSSKQIFSNSSYLPFSNESIVPYYSVQSFQSLQPTLDSLKREITQSQSFYHEFTDLTNNITAQPHQSSLNIEYFQLLNANLLKQLTDNNNSSYLNYSQYYQHIQPLQQLTQQSMPLINHPQSLDFNFPSSILLKDPQIQGTIIDPIVFGQGSPRQIQIHLENTQPTLEAINRNITSDLQKLEQGSQTISGKRQRKNGNNKNTSTEESKQHSQHNTAINQENPQKRRKMESNGNIQVFQSKILGKTNFREDKEIENYQVRKPAEIGQNSIIQRQYQEFDLNQTISTTNTEQQQIQLPSPLRQKQYSLETADEIIKGAEAETACTQFDQAPNSKVQNLIQWHSHQKTANIGFLANNNNNQFDEIKISSKISVILDQQIPSGSLIQDIHQLQTPVIQSINNCQDPQQQILEIIIKSKSNLACDDYLKNQQDNNCQNLNSPAQNLRKIQQSQCHSLRQGQSEHHIFENTSFDDFPAKIIAKKILKNHHKDQQKLQQNDDIPIFSSSNTSNSSLPSTSNLTLQSNSLNSSNKPSGSSPKHNLSLTNQQMPNDSFDDYSQNHIPSAINLNTPTKTIISLAENNCGNLKYQTENDQSDEINNQAQLLGNTTDEEFEIIQKAITINRQNANKNLIKAFQKYVNATVTAVYDYHKATSKDYYFKLCQDQEIIKNDSPTSKDKAAFFKKFNKFISNKTYTNIHVKQIIQNRIYGQILFKDFLENNSISWLESANVLNRQSYLAVIKFYSLCCKRIELLDLLNDAHSHTNKQTQNNVSQQIIQDIQIQEEFNQEQIVHES